MTGDYLSKVTKGIDETGGPAVHFSFNAQGDRRFESSRSKTCRIQATRRYRYLGIVLDKMLLSAPRSAPRSTAKARSVADR